MDLRYTLIWLWYSLQLKLQKHRIVEFWVFRIRENYYLWFLAIEYRSKLHSVSINDDNSSNISDTNTVKLLWKLHITDTMYHRYERSMLGCHFFPVLVIVQLIGSNPYFSERCVSFSIENRSNSIIKPNIGLR